MSISATSINTLWLIFVLYWFVLAFFAKKSIVRGLRWRQTIWFRVLLIIAVLIIVHVQSAHNSLWKSLTFSFTNPIVNTIGIVVCALGLGLAVWARMYLGRNWGMPMSLRKNHELVTSGPYRYIRHPIYSGILLAALGSTLASTTWWLLVCVAYGAYFFYSVNVEENMMTKEFPDHYPAYMAKTKQLIPFVY